MTRAASNAYNNCKSMKTCTNCDGTGIVGLYSNIQICPRCKGYAICLETTKDKYIAKLANYGKLEIDRINDEKTF